MEMQMEILHIRKATKTQKGRAKK